MRKTILRQGDIVLEKVDKLPKNARFTGRELRMTGETGRDHVVTALTFQTPLQTFVEVGKGGAVMVHPQHPDLAITPGVHQVRRVRTYNPARPVDVVD